MLRLLRFAARARPQMLQAWIAPALWEAGKWQAAGAWIAQARGAGKPGALQQVQPAVGQGRQAALASVYLPGAVGGAAFCRTKKRKETFSEAEAGFGLQVVWEIVGWVEELE